MEAGEEKKIIGADKPEEAAKVSQAAAEPVATAEPIVAEETVAETGAPQETAVINLSGDDDIMPEKVGWLEKMRREDKRAEEAERTEQDILDLNNRLSFQQVAGKFSIILGLIVLITGIMLYNILAILVAFTIIGGLTVLISVYFNQFNFRLVVRALEEEIIKGGVKAEAEVADAVVLKAGKTYRECKVLFRIRGTKKMVFRIETYDNIEAIPIGKKYEIAYEHSSGFAVKIKELEEFSGERSAVPGEKLAEEKIAAAESEMK